MSNIPLIEVTGFEDLRLRLQALGSDKQKRSEILKVLRKVALGTVRVARRNAPVSSRPHMVSGKRTKKTIQPGNLRKSIGVITSKRAKNPTVYVGPRAKGNHDGWYGHFVERGHNIYNNAPGRGKRRNKFMRRSGRNSTSGFVEGQPFMQKTYDETKGQVTAETEQAVAKVIQKTIDRLSNSRSGSAVDAYFNRRS